MRASANATSECDGAKFAANHRPLAADHSATVARHPVGKGRFAESASGDRGAATSITRRSAATVIATVAVTTGPPRPSAIVAIPNSRARMGRASDARR
jgi:hypothetical protein